MTLLEAINTCLEAIGTSHVNDEDLNQPDVVKAKDQIERLHKRIQKRGFWFNLDYDVILQHDTNTGEIILPSNVSTIVPHSTQYVRRGNKIYDKVNQTYNIGCDIQIWRMITILPFDELPESLQEQATYEAAAKLVRTEVEDTALEKKYNEDAMRSNLVLKQEDLEQGGYNIFNRGRVVQARRGVQPYTRNNKRFSGDPDV